MKRCTASKQAREEKRKRKVEKRKRIPKDFPGHTAAASSSVAAASNLRTSIMVATTITTTATPNLIKNSFVHTICTPTPHFGVLSVTQEMMLMSE